MLLNELQHEHQACQQQQAEVAGLRQALDRQERELAALRAVVGGASSR
jgi:hypothetical protein